MKFNDCIRQLAHGEKTPEEFFVEMMPLTASLAQRVLQFLGSPWLRKYVTDDVKARGDEELWTFAVLTYRNIPRYEQLPHALNSLVSRLKWSMYRTIQVEKYSTDNNRNQQHAKTWESENLGSSFLLRCDPDITDPRDRVGEFDAQEEWTMLLSGNLSTSDCLIIETLARGLGKSATAELLGVCRNTVRNAERRCLEMLRETAYCITC